MYCQETANIGTRLPAQDSMRKPINLYGRTGLRLGLSRDLDLRVLLNLRQRVIQCRDELVRIRC